MTRDVVLLRGVNIGTRQLAMAALRELCTAAGCSEVRTYVQSGNVVLRSDRPAGELAVDLEARLFDHCGWDVPVVVRTAAEMSAVVESCPFDTTVDPTRLVVAFAPRDLVADDLDPLDPGGFGGETFAAADREVYLWLPDGQGRSPLAKAFLATPAGRVCTMRNWRTATTLREWANAA